jgi:hypothetical protein
MCVLGALDSPRKIAVRSRRRIGHSSRRLYRDIIDPGMRNGDKMQLSMFGLLLIGAIVPFRNVHTESKKRIEQIRHDVRK